MDAWVSPSDLCTAASDLSVRACSIRLWLVFQMVRASLYSATARCQASLFHSWRRVSACAKTPRAYSAASRFSCAGANAAPKTRQPVSIAARINQMQADIDVAEEGAQS